MKKTFNQPNIGIVNLLYHHTIVCTSITTDPADPDLPVLGHKRVLWEDEVDEE